MKTYLKKNKALLILPLVLLPFVVLIFYVLGGGEKAKNENRNNSDMENPEGANYVLPEAESTIEIFDKMEAYQQGLEHSSTKDYNVMGKTDSLEIPGYEKVFHGDSIGYNSSHEQQLSENTIPDNLLAHIRQKEQDIKMELEGQDNTLNPERNNKTGGGYSKKGNTGYTRKEESTDVPSNPKNQSQTQLAYNSTGIDELDKVFDENIVLNRQNDSLKFYLEQTQNLLSEIEQRQNASFSLDKKQLSGFGEGEKSSSLIKAEIYETTTVLDGNRVKLRLLEDTWINKKKIARNSFIYGICKINNERLLVEISQMPVGDNFLPVNLAIHDLDGLPGLYVPDNVARKVSKEVGSSTNTSSLFGVTSDPLTYAGIRAADRTAQTLLKRVRLKKVTLKKNTLVYLINQQ